MKDYPLILEKQSLSENMQMTRSIGNEKLVEYGKCPLTQKTYIHDAIKLWNELPVIITKCETLNQIKKQAKTFAKTLSL